ncbi:MAG: carbon storage regulator [Gemmataceae bacterium]
MLVLSRKKGEQISIGDQVYVTVVAVHGNQVRLGISAPEDMAISRQELTAEQRKRRPATTKHAQQSESARPTPCQIKQRHPLDETESVG